MKAANGKLTKEAALLLAALILAAVAALVPGTAAIRHRELSFDGGFNAQVARTLAEKHRYATTYRGLHDFDHRVQTGPTVIVPTAVFFRLFGIDNTTAQLTNLVYLLVLFLLTTVLAWRLGGPLAAFLVTPVLLATPHLFQLGTGLLGEIPALAFLLAGALVLESLRPSWWRAAAAGLLLGLAVLTKFQMVLPAAVLAATLWLLDRRGERPPRSHPIAAASGFVAALAPLELAKLHTFGWPVYLQWWRDMLGRSLAQGTSFRIPNTVTGPGKPWVHLGILARQMDLPPLLAALLVALPLLLVASLLRRRHAAGRRAADHALLTALAAAGLALVAWWLFLAPTSRTWFRRVVDGVVLLEMVGTIAVVRWTRRLCQEGAAPSPPGRTGRVRRWLTLAAVVLLGQALSVLVWTQLPTLARQVAPSPQRTATAVMVAAINALPPGAAIYAKGWYEAPVLAALTGRSFLDLDQFPIDRYRTPLRHTYFIADAAMRSNRPDEIDDVLGRAGAVLIKRAGGNTLYELERLCPYPPIDRPPDGAVLPTVFRPGEGPEYPYRGGIGRDPARPREAHVVSGVLLARHRLGCLTIDLYLNEAAGAHPTVTVRLDGAVVLEERADAPGRFFRTVPLGPAPPGTAEPSLVELVLRRDREPRPFMLWHRDWGLYSVLEVGFTGGCPPGPEAPGPGGPPAANPVAPPASRGSKEP